MSERPTRFENEEELLAWLLQFPPDPDVPRKPDSLEGLRRLRADLADCGLCDNYRVLDQLEPCPRCSSATE